MRDNDSTIETERQRAYEGSPETEGEDIEAEADEFLEQFKSGEYKIKTFANLVYKGVK